MIHKPFTLTKLVAAVVLTLVSVTALAQTRYVDDELLIMLRSGEGNQFRIVDSLPSGTRLNVIEEGDSGYSHVRTQDGQEGWVLTRYLSPQPIARDRLAAAQRKLEQTESDLKEARSQLQSLQSERNELATSEESLQSRAGKLSAELDRIKEVSSNALTLDRRNRELQESNQQLKKEVEVLTAENERLEAKKETDFMMLGALLVGAGVLIAIVVPWLKPTRKTDNWA
ncbi:MULTISPECIES: TIGR04211 family SH3 domain-containing protein [Marinobacter]|uniref:TIGR04211 family SH3 domain-containing protein n=1 Tax=Marinobacter TaxID=2742 RepID=UPI001D17939F|nr:MULTISPECIES: TIGR04211 family SH3 domain-containing protein [Marinobacter]